MTDVYTLGAAQFNEKMHPDLPGPTTFWGYYDRAVPDDRKYLGGVIVAHRGTPVLLQVSNELPNKPVIPVDPTIMAGEGLTVGQLPANRTTTHLHGSLTPWFSDGTPFQWYTPRGDIGSSFSNVPNAGVTLPTPPNAFAATYYYPNQMSARLMWYHDHAIGITRTNVYSGLVSAYVLTDAFEQSLVGNLLPPFLGPLDLPLIIQDKSFVSTDVATQDASWTQAGGGPPGSLWYPHVYAPLNDPNDCTVAPSDGRWDYGGCSVPPVMNPEALPPLSIVGEAFLDTILVNGGVYPVHNVPRERVRFRILNGSNSRFLHLNLYREDPNHPGEPEGITANNSQPPNMLPNGVTPPVFGTGTPGPIMYQIGNEGGFLPAVVPHRNETSIPFDPTDTAGLTADPAGPFNLLLAPAERADVVIDFGETNVAVGDSFILYNDAPGPFPGGDPRNDYFTDAPDQTMLGGAPPTVQGMGPNTRTLMRFVVNTAGTNSPDTTAWLASMNTDLMNNFLNGEQQPPIYTTIPPFGAFAPFTGTPTRVLTLNEDFDEHGRLIQTLGTNTSPGANNQGVATFGRGYEAPGGPPGVMENQGTIEGPSVPSGITETPHAGATEVWQIFNVTADTHPMHFHLVNVQVIQRQAFNLNAVLGVPSFDPSAVLIPGTVREPDDNEKGWKETVRMNPGEATTIIMRFDLPALPQPMTVGDPSVLDGRNPASSPRTGGHEYVWHCHILEHEDHDMMRAITVRGAFPPLTAAIRAKK